MKISSTPLPLNRSYKQPKIVVVDDDLSILSLIQMILKSEGFTNIDLYPYGRVALDRILESPPSLVLLDLIMPCLSGYEVLEMIKSSSSIPSFPVIVLSSLHEDEFQSQALKLGAYDFISKPFNIEHLIDRVHFALRENSTRSDFVKTHAAVRYKSTTSSD